MRQRIRGDWGTIYGAVRPEKSELFRELCRLFDSGERYMLCALSHGQVSIDGYIIRVEHLRRWPLDRLRGRYATITGTTRQLFGSTPVERLDG